MQSVLQGVHAQGNVHSRAVGEEGSQSGLNKQTEDQDSVPVGQKIRITSERGKGLVNEMFKNVTVANY